MRTPLLKPDARAQTGTKLLAAITGKALRLYSTLKDETNPSMRSCLLFNKRGRLGVG
jgi:hypothetical protein